MIAGRRRAKIIATVGPACASREEQLSLVEAGADLLRVNTSHLSPDQAEEVYRQLVWVREEASRPFAILCDLCGPKLRLSSSAPEMELSPGEEVRLSEQETPGAVVARVPGLSEAVKEGSEIVLGDGYPTLQVINVEGGAVLCSVVRAGKMKPRMGVALPGTAIDLPALTEEDRAHIEAAAPYADWIAQSFVKDQSDIQELRGLLDQAGSQARILAKIERFSALGAAAEIIAAADAVMVARGDLGVEIGLAAVPFEQDRLIRSCRQMAKPSVTATQVLDSMTQADLPTRAEASDVAQALVQGTSALMLSGETAVGEHPALTVEVMSQLITRAESHLELRPQAPPEGAAAAASMVRAADQLAYEQDIPIVIIPTNTGATARLAAAIGRQQVIALCVDPQVERQLCLERGVWPISWDGDHGTYLPLTAIERACEAGLLREGRRVVVAWGFKPQQGEEMHLIAALSAPEK